MQYLSEQKRCATCDFWRGARMRADAHSVSCPRNVAGTCPRRHGETPPDASCEEWTPWAHEWSAHPYLGNINCWEYTACGFEEGGRNAAGDGVCPAYPDRGRDCVSVMDTKCRSLRNPATQAKPEPSRQSCPGCPFYRNVLAPAGTLPAA